ncbi:MAG: spore germination protein [Clostridia bacterium]|nr:spore germination protein [Clostridia bacterium]
MNLEHRQQELDQKIGANTAFDIKKRPFCLGGKRGMMTFVIGYTDGVLAERILSALQSIEKPPATLTEVMERDLSFASAEATESVDRAAAELLRGSAVLMVEGYEDILILDARTFPLRENSEPEKDRTLRGPHTGTNESLISNLVQIRRYLRTAELVTERFSVGTEIPTDVAVIHLAGRADPALLERIRSRLKKKAIPALSMTQETLANHLFPPRGLGVLNPFPRVRYTERPDVVAATLMEGKVAVLCDNSPSILLLPESIFDFFEEADDYYFPPLTATYLRLVRGFVFAASVFLIPIWLLVMQNAGKVPAGLHFILAEEPHPVPLFLQFLVIELALDGLKMASLNTPSTLSNSFSVIGGLLLGEFAVKSGWFLPQTILYAAFTGIANYVPTNYELGYSFKFMRMSLIIAVAFFGSRGFLFATAFWLLVLAGTRSSAGKGYLYPFYPFDLKGIARLFFRHKSGKEREGLRQILPKT